MRCIKVVELNLEIISVVIACASITVGVISLLIRNRREVKTREVQLFLQYSARRTEEGFKTYQEVMSRQDWKTFDEFWEKYGPTVNPDAAAKVFWLVSRYNVLGFLVKEGLIDFKLIYRYNPRNIIRAWERFEPYVMGVRKRFNNPTLYDSFKWLYKQNKREQQLASKTA